MLNSHTPIIETLTMIPSGQGRFEVLVGDNLIYSKKATGRHAEPGEVLGAFEALVAVPA